jgi:hypothetical protein
MFRLLLGLFALPLAAQPPGHFPELPARVLKPDRNALRVMRLPLTVAPPKVSLDWPARMRKTPDSAQKPCAVPLVNALRFRDPDPPIRKYSPRPPFNMREFPVPAPSCEDRERR